MMTRWTAALAALAAAVLTGCASTTTEPPLEGMKKSHIDVRIATADSGRVYLYFSPDDFREKVDYVSMNVTESARWLQRTYYQYIDVNRERVRVDRRPGFVEIGIAGTLSRGELDQVIGTTTELKQKHGKLPPIKVICRLEEGTDLPAPMEDVTAEVVKVQGAAADQEPEAAVPDEPVVEVVDPEADAAAAEAEERERRKRRSWGDYDFPM